MSKNVIREAHAAIWMKVDVYDEDIVEVLSALDAAGFLTSPAGLFPPPTTGEVAE